MTSELRKAKPMHSCCLYEDLFGELKRRRSVSRKEEDKNSGEEAMTVTMTCAGLGGGYKIILSDVPTKKDPILDEKYYYCVLLAAIHEEHLRGCDRWRKRSSKYERKERLVAGYVKRLSDLTYNSSSAGKL